MRRLSVLAASCVLWGPTSATLRAQPVDEAPRPESASLPSEWGLNVGASYMFDTDGAGGGEISHARVSTGVTTTVPLDEQLSLDVTLAYEFDAYDFSGTAGLPGLDPWDDVHAVRARATFTRVLDEEFALFGGPVVGFAAEDGADVNSSVTAGGTLGVNFRDGNDFSIGLGLGVITQIDDDVAVFPFVVMNWQVGQDLTLRSGPFGLGSEGGQGLELAWDMGDGWDLSLGVQYQTRRFRLDDRGVAPDGTGEDTRFPLYLRSTWDMGGASELSVFAGLVLGGELRLETQDRAVILERDFDPGAMIGARWSVRF